MKKIKNSIKGMAFICLLLFSNCYHYKVAVDKPSSTDSKEQIVNKRVWGLREDKIIVDNCQDQYLQSVEFHTNFGQSLLNVLTLGFWKPAKITWTCGKASSDGGTIDVITDPNKN